MGLEILTVIHTGTWALVLDMVFLTDITLDLVAIHTTVIMVIMDLMVMATHIMETEQITLLIADPEEIPVLTEIMMIAEVLTREALEI